MNQQLKVTHYGNTDIGNVRQANEDSLGFMEGPYGPTFTVCDGMGGHVGGAAASSLAVTTILEFISSSTVENPSVTINNALISANQKVFEAAIASPELKGMGTTATILVVQPQGVYIGHVGDSRIYIFSDNKLYRLTKDDSLVQTLIDSGAITDEEAENHPRKNELLKAIGVSSNVQPTIGSMPIKPKKDDIFLLCSDGLCGLVHDRDIERILATTTDLVQAGEQLISAAKSAGGFDNITVQLVKVTESPYMVSYFNSYSPQQLQTQEKVSAPPQPANNHKSWMIRDRRALQRAGMLRMGIAVLGAAVIYSIVALFTHSWPFKKVAVVGSDSLHAVQPDKNGLLPGDKISHGFLIHTLTDKEKKESLAILVNERKAVNKPPYSEYDFDTTYAFEDDIAVDESSFRDLSIPILKWTRTKAQATIRSSTKITVTADSTNAANQRKNTTQPLNKDGDRNNEKDKTGNKDETPDTEEIRILNDSLEKVNESLNTITRQATELDKKIAVLKDSLKHQPTPAITAGLEKAKADLDKAHKAQKGWNEKRKLLRSQIEALRKKLKEQPIHGTTVLSGKLKTALQYCLSRETIPLQECS